MQSRAMQAQAPRRAPAAPTSTPVATSRARPSSVASQPPAPVLRSDSFAWFDRLLEDLPASVRADGPWRLTMDLQGVHCAACVDLCERADAPPFLAHTKDTWAGILIDRGGDPDRARQLALEALATAEELGMARLAETATRHLTALG